ncbi:MAG: PTS sugar transporter subunit IIA [Verrucomicrobia bacterium]|nr:PTS sugar transporter subunit IIA [Verrucomicrobiota bacterium]
MYLNLVQIAESFGVPEKVVEDWIRIEGLPYVPDRGRLLFDRARVAHWAAAHGLTARAGFLTPEEGTFASGLALEPMLRTGGIWREVEPLDAIAAIEKVIAGLPRLPQSVRTLLGQRLRTEGGINWAPVGGGVALPHFSTRVTLGRDSGVIALVQLRGALPMAEPTVDGVPVTRLFFFVPPSPRAHLDTLGKLSRAISKGPLRALLERGASDDDIYRAVAVVDAAGGGEARRGTPV